MLPMNKWQITAYRYLGCAGSCFTLFQSGVWLLLALAGAMCKYTGCGSSGSKRTFKYCFYLMYYYAPQNVTANFTRVNYISPTCFHVIMWINVLLCIGNIVISVFTAKAFIQWKNAKEVRKMAYIWIRCILAFAACELIMFIIFASDVVSIKQKEDVKCFLQTNLTLLQSSYTSERTPAPYLLQLKANLKTMKKKIRKFKRNLLLLDAVFDEKSPDHVKNPFISKNVVDNYVEDIWKSMFNNSIREKVRRKADVIPLDEGMRNFIISEHLDLDEMDFDLLKNFDGLVNNKWTKPIKSSNVVFGRQFDLSPSIAASNDSAELDKITSLLNEYLKDNEMPTNASTNDLQPDPNFDDFFKELFDELEEQETHFVNNENNVKSLSDKADILTNQNHTMISNDYEEVLLSLRNFFDSMIPQKKEHEPKELNDQSMQAVMHKIKDFLENNQTAELSYDEIYNNVKESLKHQFELNNSRQLNLDTINRNKTRRKDYYDSEYDSEEEEKPAPKKKPPTKAPKAVATTKATPKPSVYKNELIQELCENCAYFILAPSIVCMILSLKTGLVWVLNIVVAVLLLYYGSKITLKTKCKIKFFPCLYKKK